MNSILFYCAFICLVAESIFGFLLSQRNHSNVFDLEEPENSTLPNGFFSFVSIGNTSLPNPFFAAESNDVAVVAEMANVTNPHEFSPASFEELCKDLTERYKSVERKDAHEGCPFSVDACAMNGNREVNVTLFSFANATFNEFMIQPRNANDHKEIVPGQFTATVQSQAIACFTSTNKNTLTQSNKDPKSYINAIWKPRSNVAFLKIIFYATVYVEGHLIYEKVLSEDITVTSSPGMHHL